MIKYYIIDTETNGLSTKLHEINEISIVRYDDKVQLTEFIKCEHPERSSFDALKITNKTLKDLERGVSRIEAVNKVEKFLMSDGLTPAHRCMIGHNIPFDRKFLHSLWESVDKEFPANLWLDTKSLTQKYIKDKDLSKFAKTSSGKVQLTLHACCDILKASKPSSAHSAKVDSQATFFLWRKLKEENVDYIREIKNIPHVINKSSNEDDEGIDLSNLI